jgi:hypothetical protein
MERMSRRSLFRLSVFVAGFGLAVSSLAIYAQQDTSRRGRKYKVPPPSSRIEVTVVRDVNGKPIENAAVVFHPMEGERDKGAMELKTNEDGKAIIDVIPIGDTVRMQVIAKGFQTYGQDFKVDKPEIVMDVRLKRPGEQYSIYKNSGETPDAGKGSGTDNTAPSSKDAAPSSQPDAQPQPK